MDALWVAHFMVLMSAAQIFLTGTWGKIRRSFRGFPVLLLFPLLLVPRAWAEQGQAGSPFYAWQGKMPSSDATRSVTINGTRLSEQTLSGLERLYRVRIMNGDYWYDRISGAWGIMGGPTVGFILPNLNLGGPLRANASNGNTGVFVNGRQLHLLDVLALQQITPVLPGRYWVNAQGYGGYEGGPAFFNLVQLAQAAGGKRGGAWSHTSKYTGASVGGDGDFFYFMDKNSSYTLDR